MAEENKNMKPKATLIKHARTRSATSSDSAQEHDQATSSGKSDKKRVVVVKKKKVVVKRPVVHQTTVQQPDTSTDKDTAVTQENAQKDADQNKVGNTVNSAQPNQQRVPSQTRSRVSSDRNSDRPNVQRTNLNDKAAQNNRNNRGGYSRPSGQDNRGGYNRSGSQDNRGGYSRPSGQDNRGGYNRSGSQDNRGGYSRPSGQDNRGGYKQQRNSQNYRPYNNNNRNDGNAGSNYTRGPAGNSRNTNYRNNYGQRPGNNTRPQRPGGTASRPPFRKPAGGTIAPEQNKKPTKKVFKTKNKKRDYQKAKRVENREKDFQIKRKTVKRANPVPKKIDIMEVITVSELAKKMNLKASELIGKLMGMGMMVTINQQIDAETAGIIAAEYDCEVNIVSLYDETVIDTESDKDTELRPRPPIITVMGHVDHGKTKLLDAIRETNVVDGEFGGITQHVGAYTVSTGHGAVVFLDTPGHSAFTLMRARGAQVTDIVVLVVAANDGVMPQTIEAIDHAKEAGVPIIVAINKIDLPEANVDRVKQQLSEYDLLPESWGGSTLFCEISALKRTGIDELMETILLQAEMLELKANYDCRAEGRIIESRVDHGRGIVSTVIIQRGTLHIGDPFVAGVYPGKVRAMFDDKGKKITEATPAIPVEILGFTGIPSAGAPFQCTENEKQARQVGAKRQELERHGEAQNVKKVTLDNLFDSIQDGEVQELKVIIKGDVHGSVEALQSALEKLSTSEIRLLVIHASAGAIIENDINLAIASNAIVIGFNVRPTPKAQLLAEREKIDIRKYNIIYDVVDDIKAAMEGMLSPDLKEEVIGKVEVRDIFKVPKIGVIAGAYVLEGKVKRNAIAHIIRDGIEIYTGKITSLKRFKDDAREVSAGYECGVGFENYQDIKIGDIFEVIEIIEVAKKL